MTTLVRLLAQKQQLLERLQEDPGLHERAEIERVLEEIDQALNLLDEAGPGTSARDIGA
jgi:hypothetical protein